MFGVLLRRTWRYTAAGVSILTAAALLGCAPAAPHEAPDGEGAGGDRQFNAKPPLAIFCTTGQVADAVRHIAGDHADVTALMGPGVDPHLFRPKPSDVVRLKRADIVFYNGLHLEGRIVETLETLAEQKPVVPVTAGLVESKDPRLRRPPEFEGYYDPHVWHDVRMWADCVDYAASRLAEFDPARSGDYHDRAKQYRAELEQLDRECRDRLAVIPADRRILVTAHDAFGYFSAAYDMETVGLKGISTEDQVDFHHLDQVRRLLVERRVPAVFVESSTSPRLIQQLIEESRAAGHTVRVGAELYSDALGPAGSGAEDYVGMIRANVDAIVEGLAGDADQAGE